MSTIQFFMAKQIKQQITSQITINHITTTLKQNVQNTVKYINKNKRLSNINKKLINTLTKKAKMKIYKQSTNLESINEFQSLASNESYSHSPYYQRIKQQVNSLIFQPPNNFCVTVFEQTKVRIVLRIKYFVSQRQKLPTKCLKFNSNINSHAKKSLFRSNNVQSIFIEEHEQHNDSHQQSYQSQHNYILFTCIIDYGIYPFSPPYLIVTENIDISHDLTINNFSNITDEILHSTSWFPSFTLEDILKNIPDFVQNLKQNQTSIKSSYYYEKPFRKVDIRQHALGLKIYEGQTFDRKDSFLGKYLKKVIGITFKSLIFFRKDDTNGLKVCNVFPLNEIEGLSINQSEKRIKFTLIFKEKLQVSYKFIYPVDSKKSRDQISSRDYFLNWMKLCLSKAMYENFKKTKLTSGQNTEKVTNSGHKGTKISNAQNQNSIYNFVHRLEQKGTNTMGKQIDKALLIQKQQRLSIILQILDLLLCSSVYRPYQKQQFLDSVEDLDQSEKSLSPQHSSEKFHNEMGRKSMEIIKEASIDLTKNEFIKLKHLKSVIENELKQVFNNF